MQIQCAHVCIGITTSAVNVIQSLVPCLHCWLCVQCDRAYSIQSHKNSQLFPTKYGWKFARNARPFRRRRQRVRNMPLQRSVSDSYSKRTRLRRYNYFNSIVFITSQRAHVASANCMMCCLCTCLCTCTHANSSPEYAHEPKPKIYTYTHTHTTCSNTSTHQHITNQKKNAPLSLRLMMSAERAHRFVRDVFCYTRTLLIYVCCP